MNAGEANEGYQHSVKWLDAFLCERNTCARWNKAQSAALNLHQGARQGTVLAPICWNDFSKSLLQEGTKNGALVVAYADDVAIVVEYRDPRVATSILQRYIRVIEKCRLRNNMSLSAAKTVLLTLHPDGSAAADHIEVTIDGKIYSECQEARYEHLRCRHLLS